MIFNKTQYRYEQKFVFENKTTDFVEEIIKTHPARFKEVFQQRQINNIYFDQSNLGFYSDHKNDIADRRKVRIRWYGDTYGKISHPVLEYKIRNADLGIKKSYPLPEFIVAKNFDFRSIKQSLTKANLPLEISTEMMMLEAQLINSYCRNYYKSADLSFRITIDQKLTYYDGVKNLKLQEKDIDFNSLVMELKFGLDKSSDIINQQRQWPKKDPYFSKYVLGVERLNLLNDK